MRGACLDGAVAAVYVYGVWKEMRDRGLREQAHKNKKEYCEIHTCSVDECDQVVVVDGEVCIDHVCAALNCPLEKMEGSEYCGQHTCAIEGCYEQVKRTSAYCRNHCCAYTSCPELPIDGGVCCEEHTCNIEGCLNQAKDSGPYCIEHGCRRGFCKNLHVSGGEYCAEHTCKKQGCLERLSYDVDGYCEEHHAEMAEKEKQSLLAKLSKRYDKVEDITWYKPQNYPYYANSRSYVLP